MMNILTESQQWPLQKAIYKMDWIYPYNWDEKPPTNGVPKNASEIIRKTEGNSTTAWLHLDIQQKNNMRPNYINHIIIVFTPCSNSKIAICRLD